MFFHTGGNSFPLHRVLFFSTILSFQHFGESTKVFHPCAKLSCVCLTRNVYIVMWARRNDQRTMVEIYFHAPPCKRTGRRTHTPESRIKNKEFSVEKQDERQSTILWVSKSLAFFSFVLFCVLASFVSPKSVSKENSTDRRQWWSSQRLSHDLLLFLFWHTGPHELVGREGVAGGGKTEWWWRRQLFSLSLSMASTARGVKIANLTRANCDLSFCLFYACGGVMRKIRGKSVEKFAHSKQK